MSVQLNISTVSRYNFEQQAEQSASSRGVNSTGLHVALTNRRGDLADPARRSRGQLCADALRHASARAACDWVLDHLLHVRYNPCNLLFSDGIDAFCIHYDGHGARAETLKAGLHLLSDTDVNDLEHPRIGGERERGGREHHRRVAVGRHDVDAQEEQARALEDAVEVEEHDER